MKAFVVGGSGYSGGELLRILLKHPSVDGISSSSRTYLGKRIDSVHQNLAGFTDEKFVEFDPSAIDADIVFLALPHGKSMEHVPGFLESGIKVVDLSADYRINDVSLYEAYYVKHTSPELLDKSVYGLCELNR